MKWGPAGDSESGGGGQYVELAEEVKSKMSWDRQKETAKLLDLESPVDTRRLVFTFQTYSYTCIY